MTVVVPGVSGLRELGSGEFSVVYQGVQDAFGRSVAVKVLRGPLDGAALARFQKECLAVGPVSHHPNIVTVLDANVTPAGDPYMMMELFANGSLGALLEAKGPRPLEEVLATGIALCGALETAHRANVFHRDVKPENVLVGNSGEAVLADFGVAVAGAQMGPAELAFTAAHAAPEVLIDQPEPTTAADVYSLGSTLYELLAGAPAFPALEGEPRLAHYRRIAAQPVPPIGREDVPTVAFEVIESAMAKRPEDRPGVLELSRRLGDLQDQLHQVRTEPVVLSAGSAADPADEADHRELAEPRKTRAGTLLLDRKAAPEAPDSALANPTRSKAPLVILGTSIVAACIIVAAAIVASAPGGGGSAPTTTAAASLPPPMVTTSLPPMTGTPSLPPTTVAASTTTLQPGASGGPPGPAVTVAANLIPTGVSVVVGGGGDLTVRWTAPAKGAPLRYFVLYNSPSAKARAKGVPGTETTASVDGAGPASCVLVVAVFPSPTGTGVVQGQSDRACP